MGRGEVPNGRSRLCPGCDAVGKLDYVLEHRTSPDDVVLHWLAIQVSDAPRTLSRRATGGASDPDSRARRRARLRLDPVRSRAQRLAILTSNGSRKDLDRPGGAGRLETSWRARADFEPEACSRIAALVARGARREACDSRARSRNAGLRDYLRKRRQISRWRSENEA